MGGRKGVSPVVEEVKEENTARDFLPKSKNPPSSPPLPSSPTPTEGVRLPPSAVSFRPGFILPTTPSTVLLAERFKPIRFGTGTARVCGSPSSMAVTEAEEVDGGAAVEVDGTADDEKREKIAERSLAGLAGRGGGAGGTLGAFAGGAGAGDRPSERGGEVVGGAVKIVGTAAGWGGGAGGGRIGLGASARSRLGGESLEIRSERGT